MKQTVRFADCSLSAKRLAVTHSMGHHINGIIAEGDYLDGLAIELGLRRPTRLTRNFRFLPLDDDELDRLFSEPGPYDGHFTYLSEALLSLILEHSRRQPLAYIETEYFGGLGDQSAVLARDGTIAFGPAEGPGTINHALQLMGVTASVPGLDEFDTIGLGWVRNNDDIDVPEES